MVIVLHSFFLTQRQPSERRSFAFRRRSRRGVRHILLALVVGCLAISWVRARRQRRSVAARSGPISRVPDRRPEPSPPPSPPPSPSQQPQPSPLRPPPPSRALTPPHIVAGAPKPAILAAERKVTMPAWTDLSASTDVASRWMERAD